MEAISFRNRRAFQLGVVGDAEGRGLAIAPAEFVETGHEEAHAYPEAEKQVGVSRSEAGAAFGGVGAFGHGRRRLVGDGDCNRYETSEGRGFWPVEGLNPAENPR